jgi:PIN domain nuclease of toxin-antitoxin system
MKGEPNLSPKALEIIEEETNIIHVSTISFWEIAIKSVIGKLHVDEDDLKRIQIQCEYSEFNILNVEPQNTLSYLSLPLKPKHRDPFDRMLIATAIQNGWKLLSCDDTFDQYKEDGLKVLW